MSYNKEGEKVHKLRQTFYCCEVCGKAEIKTVYTVHKRIGNCENCGHYRFKNSLLMFNDYSIEYSFERYAIAWGSEF